MRRKLVYAVLILIQIYLFLFQLPCLAQSDNFIFDNLNTEVGLASKNIGAICQDQQGFIWLGSSDGLSRYDGFDCKIFTHEPGVGNSLSDQNVNCIWSDHEGDLWIGTMNGLNLYNPEDQSFVNFSHNEKDGHSISDNKIWCIAEDKNDVLWIGTSNGIDKIVKTKDKNGRKISFDQYEVITQSGISSKFIFSVCFDLSNHGWIGTDNGLYCFNANDSGDIIFQVFKHNPEDKASISSDYIWKTTCDRNDNIWILGVPSLLDCLVSNENSRTLQHITPLIKKYYKLDYFETFAADTRGNCWLGHDGGIFRFNVDAQEDSLSLSRIRQFKHDNANTRSLINNVIYCMYEDHSGNIWIGTEQGASVYFPKRELFSWNTIGVEKQRVENQDVLSIIKDHKQAIWVGGKFGGVWKCSVDGSLTYYPFQKDYSADEALYQTNCLLEWGSRIYAGTFAGVFVTDAKSNKMVPLEISGELRVSSVYAFASDQYHKLWIGTGNGVFKYDSLSQHLIKIILPDSAPSLNTTIWCLYAAMDKTLWVGSETGLFQLKNDGDFLNYYTEGNNGTSHPRITSIYEETDGNLWIGTGNGLNYFNRSNSKFKWYTSRNGLPDGYINAILSVNKDELWISTNNGLAQLNVATQKFRTYNVNDGLASNSFNLNASFEDDSGLLYFGCNEGWISFKPHQIVTDTTRPVLRLTDFEVMNQSVFLNSLADLKSQVFHSEITLEADQNFFAAQFAALNYSGNRKNKYAYMLEGLDRQWHYTLDRKLSYSGTPPGNYLLRVKAINGDEVEGTEYALRVIILPPFYKTWWFYLLMALASGTLLYLIYRFRINQIKKLYEVRTKIARDLHDDIGSRLSSISIISQSMRKRFHGISKGETELFGTLSNASKEAMDLMSDIIWSVNPENDKLENLVVRMNEFAAEILEPKEILFRIDVPDELKQAQIPMRSRKDFYLIYKEAVNNLAKYADCKNALIRLEKQNEQISITIEDDGKGFDLNDKFSGNGLKNMRHRADGIGAKLIINSRLGVGTIVKLILPIVA